MKLATVLAALSVSTLPALAQSVVTYDPTYDNPDFSLGNTACSDGVNGLQAKYPTLGKIPSFAFVGGVPGLVWNSTLCGSCWQLTYTTNNGETNTINTIDIVAVDAAYSFNLSLEAMNALTSGLAVEKGKVTAAAVQVDASVCGM